MDVTALIREVHKREYLWKRKKIGKITAHQRQITNQEWTIVAKRLNITRTTAKKKWRNLRDTFLKELKKIPVYNSGETYCFEESEKPTWVHFNDLIFLLDTYKPNQEAIDIQEESVIDIHSSDAESSCGLIMPEATLPPMNPQAENSFPSIRKVYTIAQDDMTDACDVQVKGEPEGVTFAAIQVPLHDGPPPLAMISPLAAKSSSTSTKRLSTLEETNDLESARPLPSKRIALESDASHSELKQNEESVDENENLAFFRSLLPYMSKMDPIQQLRVRMQFQKVLLEELCP